MVHHRSIADRSKDALPVSGSISPSRIASGKRQSSDFVSFRRNLTLSFVGIVVGSLLVTSTNRTARTLQTSVTDVDSSPPLIVADERNDNVTLIQEEAINARPNDVIAAFNETLAVVDEPTRVAPRIPSILLAGTQKASTSAVAVYLMKLNNTCFSDPDQGEEGGHGKESHFFDLKYDGGLPLYQNLFQKCQESDLLIDGTPETMLHPRRVREIYDEQGTADQVRIIFILREPVERSVSWYNHQLRYAILPNRPFWTNGIVGKNGRIKSYIEHQRSTVAINFKYRQYDKIYGYYAYWLKQWSELFDRKRQILVVAYTELVQNPQRMLRRIHDFLELPYTDEPMELTYENTNAKKTPPPPCEHQLEMAKYFEGPNRELYKFMQDRPGPVMEQRPFPKFQLACRQEQEATS